MSDAVYEVERIIRKRKMKGGIKYLIKWKGYEETTWEPRKNLIVEPTNASIVHDYITNILNCDDLMSHIESAIDATNAGAFYRKVSKLLHPDTCKDPRATEAFKKFTQAYEDAMTKLKNDTIHNKICAFSNDIVTAQGANILGWF